MTLDWKPVIRSLLQHLGICGITPFSVYDGAYLSELHGIEEHERLEQAVDLATGQDECRLSCRWWNPDGHQELVCSFVLVFGNDPEELVADYFFASDCDLLSQQIEMALQGFNDEWSGKPCPQKGGADERIIVRVTETNVGFVNFDSREEAEEWIEEPTYEDVRWTILDSSSVIVDDDEDDSTDGSSWEDDSIQFPRLIAELEAQGGGIDHPAQIRVDIEAYLRDTPPWDEPIDESLIPELAAEIARRFDSAEVYDQIDRLGCQLLREHKLKPAVDELVDVTLNPGDYPSPC